MLDGELVYADASRNFWLRSLSYLNLVRNTRMQDSFRGYTA